MKSCLKCSCFLVNIFACNINKLYFNMSHSPASAISMLIFITLKKIILRSEKSFYIDLNLSNIMPGFFQIVINMLLKFHFFSVHRCCVHNHDVRRPDIFFSLIICYKLNTRLNWLCCCIIFHIINITCSI